MKEETVIETIAGIMPAVVSVIITKHLKDIEKEAPPELSHLISGKGRRKKINIPSSLVDKDGMVRVGGGSGFMVSSMGLVLTNKHVVSESKAEHTVITDQNEKHIAEVVCRDPINDIAILKIDGNNLPVLELGDSSRLRLGQEVLAIGNALGIFKNTVSKGIVSGLSRSITAQADPGSPPVELRGIIQTDAAINLGNSGGPLADLAGKVVGINTAMVSGADGIGFAIPINGAKRDLEDLIKYGRIRRPLFGIRYLTIDDNLQAKLRLPVNYGAILVRESPHDYAVAPGTPAEKAGLLEKDIILEINGEKVTADHSIQDILEGMSAGDKLSAVVLRGSKKISTELILAERK